MYICRKNCRWPKVDSWIKPNDSTFKISGKKIHVKGSPEEENSSKIPQTQQRETIFVPNRLPSNSLGTMISAETKGTSSINLVVGTGCFKKEKQVKSTRKKDKICSMDTATELTDSTSEITDLVTAWLVQLTSQIYVSSVFSTACIMHFSITCTQGVRCK